MLAKGIKKSEILRWFQKDENILRLMIAQKKFPRKTDFLGT